MFHNPRVTRPPPQSDTEEFGLEKLTQTRPAPRTEVDCQTRASVGRSVTSIGRSIRRTSTRPLRYWRGHASVRTTRRSFQSLIAHPGPAITFCWGPTPPPSPVQVPGCHTSKVPRYPCLPPVEDDGLYNLNRPVTSDFRVNHRCTHTTTYRRR